jgi:hypothetical protein
MNDELVDVRTPLAVSPNARVELGRDGTVHVLVGPITLHLDRAMSEELTTTLARAMVLLTQSAPRRRRPALEVVRADAPAALDARPEGPSASIPWNRHQ